MLFFESISSYDETLLLLAKLLNDFEMQKVFEYEVSGYPDFVNGVPPDIYRLAVIAGREYEQITSQSNAKQSSQKSISKYIFSTSIKQLENSLRIGEIALVAAADADVSSASTFSPMGNWAERKRIMDDILLNTPRLASRQSLIYHYVLRKHYELKFSGIADDIFTRIRERVDFIIGNTLLDTMQIFNAVYDNLQSDNPENWSNVVHSCRRVLQDWQMLFFLQLIPRDSRLIKKLI